MRPDYAPPEPHPQRASFGIRLILCCARPRQARWRLALGSSPFPGRRVQRANGKQKPEEIPDRIRGPTGDTDNSEIKVPDGYVVDELPPPTDIEYNFGSYHCRTEATAGTIRYTRTFEPKELNGPSVQGRRPEEVLPHHNGR